MPSLKPAIHLTDRTHIHECSLPTRYGLFRMVGTSAPGEGQADVALAMGDVDDGAPVLTRVHSECLTGDAFASLRCDCGAQLEAAMAAIGQLGRGVIIYLRQEGRGIGLMNKISAYRLQDHGADTVEANRRLGFPADLRSYAAARDLLALLGVGTVRLMTNNPGKIAELRSLGIAVVERVPLLVGRTAENRDYLRTKETRMGHWLDEATH